MYVRLPSLVLGYALVEGGLWDRVGVDPMGVKRVGCSPS